MATRVEIRAGCYTSTGFNMFILVSFLQHKCGFFANHESLFMVDAIDTSFRVLDGLFSDFMLYTSESDVKVLSSKRHARISARRNHYRNRITPITKSLSATEPRDKVYATLWFLEQEVGIRDQGHLIEVDYSKPLHVKYTKFMPLFDNTNSLNLTQFSFHCSLFRRMRIVSWRICPHGSLI